MDITRNESLGRLPGNVALSAVVGDKGVIGGQGTGVVDAMFADDRRAQHPTPAAEGQDNTRPPGPASKSMRTSLEVQLGSLRQLSNISGHVLFLYATLLQGWFSGFCAIS